MTTTNHTSPSGEDAANGAIGEREAFDDYRRGLMEAFHVANMINANRQGRTAEETCTYLVRGLAELANGGEARAALTAEKVAAEPIYQTGNENGHVWRDVTPLDYARADSHKRIVFSAPQQPAQSAEQDERAAFEAAYNAGWDASDACDNAYNNGTSEQLSVPGQSHEPEVFQRWRAEWFSNRDEVITQLLSTRAAHTQSTATQPAQKQVALTVEDLADELENMLFDLKNGHDVDSSEYARLIVARLNASHPTSGD
jgi:hypothetical protein